MVVALAVALQRRGVGYCECLGVGCLRHHAANPSSQFECCC